MVLEVADEGVGIPPEELDGIFQPFRGTFAKGTRTRAWRSSIASSPTTAGRFR